MIKRTQQNKYLVALTGAKHRHKNLFLLKMLGKLHVLCVNVCTPHIDTIDVRYVWAQ
nr:MAG TPA: hypothetical protein [Caudoviricetes sp.]